jgi:hypothetical protein
MPNVITGVNPLNTNKVYTALYNMVISQECFGGNIKGTYSQLVERAKVDVGLYGDQKWYYATDALAAYPFDMDSVDQLNILATHRPKAPEVQNIVIDKFFQIGLTLDDYMSKQAWGTEGAFSQFNSIMMGWIADTRRIIDSTTYNTFIGTNETDIGKQQHEITLVDGQNDALTIAVDLADLLVDLKDISRDYNDYGFIRSYDESDLVVLFNAKLWNQLKKADLPVIFHKEGLLDEFEKVVLPARYFGTVVDADNHTTMDIPTDGTYRTLVEKDVVRDGETVHLFPGDILKSGEQGYKDEVYKEDDTIAYKVMHKRSVPYMSAFSVNTSFFNAKNLSTNYYATFGRNTLEHLMNFPFITARVKG